MDPIYFTKFNNTDYLGGYQEDYQGNSTALTELESQLMISVLLLASCFMPIIYCFKILWVLCFNAFCFIVNNIFLWYLYIENCIRQQKEHTKGIN